MRLVEQQAVVEAWLRMELDKGSKSAVPLGEPEVEDAYRSLTQLLVQKPNCAQVFVEYDLQWCRATLTERQFRTLRTIWTGEQPVMELARALDAERSELAGERQARIREFAANPDDVGGPLIVNRRPALCSGPFVQDGNHRAVANALRMVRGAQYSETPAYVGYPALDCFSCTSRVRALWHKYRNTI